MTVFHINRNSLLGVVFAHYYCVFFLLGSEHTEITDGVSQMLCLLAVPSTLNCHDILNFVAPCHPTIQHIRIIRDGTPNQFMVLLEYVDEHAKIFHVEFSL